MTCPGHTRFADIDGTSIVPPPSTEASSRKAASKQRFVEVPQLVKIEVMADHARRSSRTPSPRAGVAGTCVGARVVTECIRHGIGHR